MALLKILGALAAVVAAALFAGSKRWNAATAKLLDRLPAGKEPAGAGRFDPLEITGLPAPAARYLRSVLSPGQPLISEFRLAQRGEFLVRPKPDGWRPFSARHSGAVAPAGFVWDARIRVGAGLDVFVRDAFVGGDGSMRASLAGLVSLVDVRGTTEIAEGALMRYLAEAPWYPTALLPSQGVSWSPIDDRAARATLTVGKTTVSLDFHFGEDGLVDVIDSPNRPRAVDGRMVPTPWRAHLWRYEPRDGMRIPTLGEVEWILPEGAQPYWRGEIGTAEFELRGR